MYTIIQMYIFKHYNDLDIELLQDMEIQYGMLQFIIFTTNS